jgi:hypothetical protein
LNTKSDYSSDNNVDLVEQDIPKLSYFDPSDAYDTNVKGKHKNLIFHLNTIVMKNANDINQLNKDSFYSEALPAKADYENSSPYFKIHNVSVTYLRNQKLFFPFHDIILYQGHRKSQAQDLQLGILECKVYHNLLLNTKSQVDFDRLLQLYMLDKTEEDNDMSWEFHKVVDYWKEKEMIIAQIISVWWNGMISIRQNYG